MENFYYFFYTITILGGIGTLTISFFNGFLEMSGIAFNARSMLSLSQSLATPTNAILASVVPLAIFALISISGIKNAMRVQIALWAVSTLGVLAFIGVLLATPHSVFVSNLNSALGPSGVANILQTAQKQGAVTTQAAFTASFAAVPLGIFFVSGWNWAVYSGGELKSSSRSSWAASVIPAVVTLVFFLAFVSVAYNTYGYDFISATGYLYNTNATAIPAGTGAAAAPIALPWVYTVFTNANPYVIAFIGLAMTLGIAVVMLPLLTLVTRMLIAYSFDRLIPAKFGSVNDRFHTPVFSTIVATIVGLIVIIISNETTFFASYITNISIGLVISTLVVAVAAIKFPYGKTKKLFEESRSTVRYKIAGVPLMAISGAVTVITFIIVLFYSFSSPTIGGVITPTSVVVSLLIPFIAPVVIYYAMRYYRSSKGISLDSVFSEIPPE